MEALAIEKKMFYCEAQIEQNKTLALKMMCALSSGQQTFSHTIQPFVCRFHHIFFSSFLFSLQLMVVCH